MKKILQILSVVLISILGGTFNVAYAQTTYYWVGGSGNWDDNIHWSLTSGGSAIDSSEPLPNDTINVIFDENSLNPVSPSEYTVTIDENIKCRDIIWKDIPNVTPTLTGSENKEFHIYGNVTIETIIDNKFPGIFEFNGSGIKIIAVTSPFNNKSTLVFNDATGNWILKERLSVNNIFIQNGTLSVQDNEEIYVRGHWTVNNISTANFKSGEGTVIFEGTAQSPQTISTKAAIGNEFYKVIIDNRGAGILLNSSVIIGKDNEGSIIFSNGIVVSNIPNVLILNNKTTAIGAKDESHVNGYVTKVGGDGDDEFFFPIGNGTYYRPAGLKFRTFNPPGNTVFAAKYINRNGDLKYPPENAENPLVVTRNEYWEIAKVGNQGADARVILSWRIPVSGPEGYYGNPDFADASKLLVCSWNTDDPIAGKWVDHTTEDYNITNDNSALYSGTLRTIETINNSDDQKIWAIGSKEIPLPIELLYFRAQAIGDVVQLNWATAAEKDNEYFTIEKTQDATSFTELTRIPGAGNSHVLKKYTATDRNPYDGITYYRLKQTDIDGKSIYSKVESVQSKSKNIFLEAKQAGEKQLEIHYRLSDADQAVLTIFDSRGVIIWAKTVTANTTTNLQMVPLPAVCNGLYIVTLQTAGSGLVKKVIIH